MKLTTVLLIVVGIASSASAKKKAEFDGSGKILSYSYQMQVLRSGDTASVPVYEFQTATEILSVYPKGTGLRHPKILRSGVALHTGTPTAYKWEGNKLYLMTDNAGWWRFEVTGQKPLLK